MGSGKRVDATANPSLTRREREIMDVVYKLGEASVAEVLEGLADPPSYSSVRTLMGLLEDKGHLSHTRDGTRYVYRPTVPAEEAGRSALSNLIDTFFGGSVEGLVSTLLRSDEVDPSTLDQLAELVESARASTPESSE